MVTQRRGCGCAREFAIRGRLSIKGDVEPTEAKGPGIRVNELKFPSREVGHAMICVKVHGTCGPPVTVTRKEGAEVHL